jgi:large subunit ribosomal protein L9
MALWEEFKIMKMLEILLLQDVTKLGNKGNIVKVKQGYGRNYLIPNRFAALATRENICLLELEKKHYSLIQLEKKEQLKQIAQELEGTACTLEAKANEDGHLFGSITYTAIAEGFCKLGFEVKAEDIEVEDAALYPIKELGIFSVKIKLHPEIIVKTKVWVVNEQQERSE